MRGVREPSARSAVQSGFVALLILACVATPDVVLINRTNRALALAPGVVVAPCTSAAYTTAELKAASEALVERMNNDDFDDDDTWVPAGAVFVNGVPGSRIGAPKPMNVIITGVKLPSVEYGSIPDESLPACGGDPQL